jgi:uncharacterized protein YcfL
LLAGGVLDCLDYPDIEVEGLDLLEVSMSTILLTELINLSGHHLQEHRVRSDQSLLLEADQLVKHLSIPIQAIITSDKSHLGLSLLDLLPYSMLK